MLAFETWGSISNWLVPVASVLFIACSLVLLYRLLLWLLQKFTPREMPWNWYRDE